MTIYDRGYRDGAADKEPAPMGEGIWIIDDDRKDYLAGWVLGQVALARVIRLQLPPNDPGIMPHPDKKDATG